MSGPLSGKPLIALLAGWIGWSVGFLLIYGVQATGCRLELDSQMVGPISVLRLLLVAATALVAVALLWFLRKTREDGPSTLLWRIVVMANWAAVIALVTFAGVLWLTLCG